MVWNEVHARALQVAFERLLGRADQGAVAFVRCLAPEVVETLAGDSSFAPRDWQVRRVADRDHSQSRTITADRAVELREMKADAVLLLVDTVRAGAGMDGIYSAAREVDEETLFGEALRLAGEEVRARLSVKHRRYAEEATKKARGHGRRLSVSVWTEFDFFCRIAAERRHPGEFLHLLGLWPVSESSDFGEEEGLDLSRLFVDRLLGTSVSGMPPALRVDALRLHKPSEQQRADLEGFLRTALTRPLLPALADLASKKHLWVNESQSGRRCTFHPKYRVVALAYEHGESRSGEWAGRRRRRSSDADPASRLESERRVFET